MTCSPLDLTRACLSAAYDNLAAPYDSAIFQICNDHGPDVFACRRGAPAQQPGGVDFWRRSAASRAASASSAPRSWYTSVIQAAFSWIACTPHLGASTMQPSCLSRRAEGKNWLA